MNINKLDMNDIITGVLILVLIYLTFNNVLQKMENFDTILELEDLSSPAEFSDNQIRALSTGILSDLTTGEIETLKASSKLCVNNQCLTEDIIRDIIAEKGDSAGSRGAGGSGNSR